MSDRGVLLAPAIVVLALAGHFVTAGETVKTLSLEGLSQSFDVGYAGESPAGSNLMHVGRMEDDTAFGIAFELGLKRYLGIRAGLLTGSFPVSAATDCPSGNCTFVPSPGAFVDVSGADWSVDDDASFSALFVELPFYYRPTRRIELFAGPTISLINLGTVRSSGLTGLIVASEASGSSVGWTAGAGVDLGAERKWMLGIIARTWSVDVDFRVDQPLEAAIRERFSDSDDMLLVGVRLGRRFGR